MILVFINNFFSDATAIMYIPIYVLEYPTTITLDGYMAISSFEEQNLTVKPQRVTFKSPTQIKRFTSYDRLQIWVK